MIYRCGAIFLLGVLATASRAANPVQLDADGVLQVDGKKTFVISVSLPPMPGARTPEGRDAFEELKDAGLNFMRIRPTTGMDDWTEKGIRSIKPWLDAAAGQGMHCWVTLGKRTKCCCGWRSSCIAIIRGWGRGKDSTKRRG